MGDSRQGEVFMTFTLIVEQLLNGLQFGLMLFLIAAGLTLVFGIMDIMNCLLYTSPSPRD